MSKHIVTGYRPYDFKDDDGRQIQGIKVFYLDEGVDENEKGLFPLNISTGIEQLSNLIEVPGVYDLDFKQRRDPKGKPILVLKSVEFVESFGLELIN